MNVAIPQEGLKEIFDQVIRKVTEQVAGISLSQGEIPPEGELYTVYTDFKRGFQMSLSFCAEASLFTRLTKSMMQEEEVTYQDVEDFTKEYFNMVCGQIVSRLFQATKVGARFGIPTFHRGRYVPEEHQEQFVINYTSDGNENAQIIHHTPKRF